MCPIFVYGSETAMVLEGEIASTKRNKLHISAKNMV